MLRKMPLKSIVTIAITIFLLLFILCKFTTITGYIDTPRPPTATATKATPQPTPKASGNIGLLGGIAISEDAIQLILGAAIAAVIAAMIIYFFSNMSKRPGEKKAEKPAARSPIHPKNSKPVVKSGAPKPTKKSEDISQDYLYSLVLGKIENEAEQPHVPPPNDYKKKR